MAIVFRLILQLEWSRTASSHMGVFLPIPIPHVCVPSMHGHREVPFKCWNRKDKRNMRPKTTLAQFVQSSSCWPSDGDQNGGSMRCAYAFYMFKPICLFLRLRNEYMEIHALGGASHLRAVCLRWWHKAASPLCAFPPSNSSTRGGACWDKRLIHADLNIDVRVAVWRRVDSMVGSLPEIEKLPMWYCEMCER